MVPANPLPLRSGWAARAWLAHAVFALGLVGASTLAYQLALSRHIHIDEFHNVFSMQLMGSLELPDYADPTELYHVVFSWLTRHLTSTQTMFLVLRAAYGALFVGLLAAMAWVQPFFRGNMARALTFIGIASWWPAWRHGFEVRHDLLLAFGVVALYRAALAAETGQLSARGAFAAGAAAAWMQLNSHKAVTLWGPALLLLVLLRARTSRGEAVRALGATGAGLGFGVATGFALFLSAGALGAYFTQLAHFARYAAGAEPFSAAPVFGHMLGTGALLSACALGFLASGLVDAVRRRLPAHHLSTLVFLGFTLLAITVNPVPFPYNLVWMTPAVTLAGVAGAHLLVTRAGRFGVPAGVVLLAASVAQFARELATDEYSTRSWWPQLELIAAAEELTAPGDPIFDGVGMVCTRPPATRDWLIHSVFMAEYERGHRDQVSEVIQRAAPPIVIGGHYRFAWLAEADKQALAAHYLALSRQLWALGAQTGAPEQEIRILRGGRYLVLAGAPKAANVGPGGGQTPSIQIDGQSVAHAGVVPLAAGPHRVVGRASIVWIGPHATELPRRLGGGSHLFGPARLPGQ